MMMLRKIPVLLAPLVLLCPMLSYGSQSEPSNFDECIIDAMRGVSSDVAARAIIESCGNLFPGSKPEAAAQVVPASVPAPAAEIDTPVPAAAVTSAPEAAAPVAPASLDMARERDLTKDELAQLSATAKVFGSTYRVTINNGNPALTLTEVTIAVWDDNDMGATRKEYIEATQIGPQTSAMVKYTVSYRGDDTGWNWGVVAARGID
jgi:hypothetical protein